MSIMQSLLDTILAETGAITYTTGQEHNLASPSSEEKPYYECRRESMAEDVYDGAPMHDSLQFSHTALFGLFICTPL